MIIDEILSQFDGNTPRNFYSFETFILNLLKIHLEAQNKEFKIVDSPRRYGDAIAEDGFDEIEGKTLIEIKFNLERMPTRLLIDQFVQRVTEHDKLLNYKNLLIINAKPVSAKFKERLKSELATNINLIVWGPEELNKVVFKHQKETKTIINNLFSLRLESAIKNDNIDWKQERETKIESLIEAYERGQFSILLGAGVSSSAGMPDWNTLLNSLFVSYLTTEFTNSESVSDSDIKQIVDRLNNVDQKSALMAARYLRKGLSKELTEAKQFTEAITNNLYKLRDTSKKVDSDLIVSICNLCMPRRTGARIRSVITYNFDDLIERQLDVKSIRRHSIYTENELYDPDELPIYHVHGFLPENSKKYRLLDKSTLVFSEEGYHQLYSDSYHWSNLVQLTNLRENNCLMIGLSMSDPNLRRLLDISARNIDKSRHYAFMQRLSPKKFSFVKEAQIIDNIKGAEQFLNRHHKLNEEIMKELGVSVIWFEEFDEIPELLKKIYD